MDLKRYFKKLSPVVFLKHFPAKISDFSGLKATTLNLPLFLNSSLNYFTKIRGFLFHIMAHVSSKSKLKHRKFEKTLVERKFIFLEQYIEKVNM